MALSDRNIVITPNRGRADDPKIEFSGANANVTAQTITLRVYPDNAGTLSFEGSAGQLFAITNDLSGTLFRVNDSSGIPSLEINADGTVTLAEFSGNVGIGTGTPVADFHVQGQTVISGRVGIGTANVVTLNSNILSVYGSAMVYGNVNLVTPAGGTSGIYFADGTYQTTLAVNRPSFGIAGTVQFAGSGNTFSGDTANFFWDDTNNRLGLGTQSPASTLDVRGGLGVTAASNFGGAVTVASLASNGAVSGTTGTFSANVAVDTNTFFVDSVGNKVGILTTLPTAILDVVGGNGDGIQFRTGTRNVTLGQFNNEVGISWGSGSVFTLQSGGLERARIDSNGNVGIATTTIQTGFTLQTQGNQSVSNRIGVGTTAIAGVVNTAAIFGTANIHGNVRLLTPTGGTAGVYFGDGTYQTTAFTGSTATASFGTAGTIQVAGAANAFSGDSGTFVFDVANDRLGIGTSAPTNVLSVWSTATPAFFNTINSAVSSNNYEILVGNSTVHGTTVGYVNNATVPYGYLSAGTTTRNIIIASNGRVGLGGTTVPQNILDVNGAVAIGAAYAGARAAPSNGLLVQGSVGIGTFTPLQPLDVRGNVYVEGTHNLFTNRVGIGTSSALGASSNVLSVYGTAMVFGNIDLGNTTAGGTGIYFSDGTFQNTAYVPTTYTTFTYTGNGSTTTYSTSPVTSSNINNTMVYVNGVYQRKETYGWSGTTITFDVAPPNFATIEIVVIQGVNAPFGSVAGDISVNGNITVSGGAIIASGSNTYVFNTVATGVYIGGNARDVQIGNAVSTTRFNSGNASTSTTTGAIVTPGGIGVGGNINVGGSRNLFTGSVGVGTSAVLGTTANVFSVYGTAMVYGNVDLRNPTGGISGIFFGDGTYQTTAVGAGSFSTKNANYTAVNGDKLLCDTSAGTFTITLPATPVFGTTVTIYDKADFTVFPLTIARNGSTIENLADDFSLDIGQTRNEIVYDGSTWHIYVSIGPRGLPGANASVSSSVAYSIALG